MKRPARKKNRESPQRRPKRWIAVGLFLLALALRWLFWQATPDSAWPYSAYYKGDAATWLAYAQALQQGVIFELGLPLRPPATGYLIASLWNGQQDGIATLRFLWCVLGALTVPLIYGAVRRSFGTSIAMITGLLCAASTGLMMLSTSLNNETPYLLLVAATLYLWEPLSQRPTTSRLTVWALLHAIACLTRVEHALYFLLVTALLACLWRSAGSSWRLPARRLGIILACFALALMPWHLHAWERIRHFNLEPPAANPATEAAWRQVEAALAGLTWDEEAMDEKLKLPAFIRRTASNFVAATVLTRGRRIVTGEDFEILEEAFGYRPRAVASFPFVALYGGLNFYLANNSRVDSGFNRAVLETPPPLVGGAGRYPRALLAGLPPPDLALTYPPHLEIVNHGFGLGGGWIRQNPGDFFQLVGSKLAVFWSGATYGIGGYNLPLGLSGVRRPVDLVVPHPGISATLWGLALLTVGLWGIRVGTRDRSSAVALAPWLIFLSTKIFVIIAFFGYARLGASVIPVLALLAALVGASILANRTASPAPIDRWPRIAIAIALALVTLEGARWMARPVVLLDGREAGPNDPWPVDHHVQRQVTIKR